MKWITRLKTRWSNQQVLWQVPLANVLLEQVRLGKKLDNEVSSLKDAVESLYDGHNMPLETPIADLFKGHHEDYVTVIAISCLVAAGYNTIEKVSKLTEKQIIALPGIGIKTTGHILDRLNAWRGL